MRSGFVALSWGERGIMDLIIPEGDKKNPEGPSRGLCPRDGPEGFFLDPEGWLKTWSRVWLLTMTFFTNSRPAVLQGDDNIHYYTVLQILFLSRVRQFFHNMDANLLVNRGIMDFSTVIIPQFANRGIMTVLKSIIIRFVSKAYDYGFQYCHNHTVC